MIENEIVHRQSGRNHIPTHAIIPTVQDALRILKKEREADKFVKLAQIIQTVWPSLNDWIAKYPHKVLENNSDWNGILNDEHRLFCLLQGNTWGKGVRLEQERVSFWQVQKVVSESIL